MKIVLISFLCVIIGLVACRTTDIETVSIPGEPVLRSGNAVPEGTQVRVRLNQPVGINNARGDQFSATLVVPVATPAGEVLIPAGATVHGTVTSVTSGADAGNGAMIRLNFGRIEYARATYALTAEIIAVDRDGPDGDVEVMGTEAVATHDTGVGTVIRIGSSGATGPLPTGTQFTLETKADITMR